jgi:hypothetical protein
LLHPPAEQEHTLLRLEHPPAEQEHSVFTLEHPPAEQEHTVSTLEQPPAEVGRTEQYGFGTWPLALREADNLVAFENTVIKLFTLYTICY